MQTRGAGICVREAINTLRNSTETNIKTESKRKEAKIEKKKLPI